MGVGAGFLGRLLESQAFRTCVPRALISISCAVLAGACADHPAGCPFIGMVGLVVRVVDASTSASICDAEVPATHPPSGMEMFQRLNDCTYTGAYAAGDYTIRVHA